MHRTHIIREKYSKHNECLFRFARYQLQSQQYQFAQKSAVDVLKRFISFNFSFSFFFSFISSLLRRSHPRGEEIKQTEPMEFRVNKIACVARSRRMGIAAHRASFKSGRISIRVVIKISLGSCNSLQFDQ